MTARLQIIIVVIIVLVLGKIIRMVQKKRLALKYALPWLGVIICLLIADLFPGIVEVMSDWMGIDLPINMLMFLGFGFILILCFVLTLYTSKQTDEIRQLAQEVALLREELEREKKNGIH